MSDRRAGPRLLALALLAGCGPGGLASPPPGVPAPPVWWPVGTPRSSMRSCVEADRGFPCDPGEECFAGRCRRECSRGIDCAPGETCDPETTYGTDWVWEGGLCTGAGVSPIPEPRLFEPWALAGHAPRGWQLAGGFLVAADPEGLRARPLGEDGTLGPPGPPTAPPSPEWPFAAGVVDGTAWVASLDDEGTWLAALGPDGALSEWTRSPPPPAWEGSFAGDRLLVVGRGVSWSAEVRPDGTLGPWEAGLLPTSESVALGVSGGILWLSHRADGPLWGAPVDALPNLLLAWESGPGWQNRGLPLRIPSGAAVVVYDGGALAIFAGPEPVPGRATDWRLVHRSDVYRMGERAVGDDRGRIWVAEEGGDAVWTTRWAP